MIRIAALMALGLGSWTAVHFTTPQTSPQALDALVTRMADPALEQATPDQLQAALDGSIKFDPAPAGMAAPFCAVTLPIQPDATIADGIAGFASDETDGSCPAPHLRHLALRLSTSPDFSQDHMVGLLRDKLGAPDEREQTADGTLRVSWLSQDRALFVEYDPRQPETASLYLIKRPSTSSL